jgi:hypothetical protein
MAVWVLSQTTGCSPHGAPPLILSACNARVSRGKQGMLLLHKQVSSRVGKIAAAAGCHSLRHTLTWLKMEAQINPCSVVAIIFYIAQPLPLCVSRRHTRSSSGLNSISCCCIKCQQAGLVPPETCSHPAAVYTQSIKQLSFYGHRSVFASVYPPPWHACLSR